MNTPGDLIYFLHIPKTSGTSVHAFLRGAIGTEHVSPPLLWDDLIQGRYAISPGTRVVTGHLTGLFPLLLDAWPRIICIFRAPGARALSHINHVQRTVDHPLHAIASGLSVEQYCAHPALRHTVDNLQARHVALLSFSAAIRNGTQKDCQGAYAEAQIGVEQALLSLDSASGLREAAIDAIQRLDAVGICEAHAESLQLFCRVFGWSVPLEPSYLNAALPSQPALADLTKAERLALARLTSIDRVVYAAAVDRFEALCGRYGVRLAPSTEALLRRTRATGAGRATARTPEPNRSGLGWLSPNAGTGSLRRVARRGYEVSRRALLLPRAAAASVARQVWR